MSIVMIKNIAPINEIYKRKLLRKNHEITIKIPTGEKIIEVFDNREASIVIDFSHISFDFYRYL